MSPRLRELRLNVERRFETGCIATLSRPGEAHAQHFTGNGLDAVRAVADYCDRYGYRVVTLSTPGTVYRDLDGSREIAPRSADTSWFFPPPPATNVSLPEPQMLGKIGRMDLLA